MNFKFQVLIPALVSLIVAVISHPLVVKMKINHEEKMELTRIREKKLQSWKVYIENLIFPYPENLREFRNSSTYLDIERELPNKLKTKINELVLASDYKTQPSQEEYLRNSKQIHDVFRELLSFLAKLGKDWKVQ